MPILNLILALVVPWILGFAIVRACLNRRYGYRAFALGFGYVLGFFITQLLFRLYTYIGRDFVFYEIIGAELALALLLLFFCKARLCSIDELRIERKLPNTLRLLVLLIFVFLLVRFAIISVDVISRPLYPWDAWWSWTTKAKIFYENLAIIDIRDLNQPWWQGQTYVPAAGETRHPYFIPLIQTFMALAYGDWQDTVINLPWLLLAIAMFLTVFGMLRYVGVNMLLATFAGYLVTSLPMLNVQFSLGGYADIWVGVCFFLAVGSLSVALNYKEKPFWLLFIIAVIMMYAAKHSSVILLPVFVLMIIWHFLGAVMTLLLGSILVAAVFLSNHFIEGGLMRLLAKLFSFKSSNVDLLYLNPVVEKTIDFIFIMDNWHFMIVAALLSLIFVLKRRQVLDNGQRALALFTVAGMTALLIFMWYAHFTSHIEPALYAGYFNRVMLYFAPVLAIAPICIYTISKKESTELGFSPNPMAN